MTDPQDELTALWLKFQAEGGVSAQEKTEIDQILAKQDAVEISPALTTDEQPAESSPAGPVGASKIDASGDLRVQIDKMTVPQKVKLAMFGNKQARAILIGDKNRMIQIFTLKNPRIQINEIEEFSKNPNMSEHVLRTIGDGREWMRSYNVKRSIVMNPKTPLDVSMRWLKFLTADDVKRLSKSKQIPQVLQVAAKKKVQEDAKKGGG